MPLIRMDDLCVEPGHFTTVLLISTTDYLYREGMEKIMVGFNIAIMRWRHDGSVCTVDNSDSIWNSDSHCKLRFTVALIILHITWLTYRWLRPTQLASIGPPARFGWSPPAQARATHGSLSYGALVRAAARGTQF